MAKKINQSAAQAVTPEKAGAVDVIATGPLTPTTGTEGGAKEEGAIKSAPSSDAAGGTSVEAPPKSDPALGNAIPAESGAAADGGQVPAIVELPQRIWVRGPAAGRWRAGRHFTAEPVAIEIDDLTDDEARAIAGDPLLTVIRAE